MLKSSYSTVKNAIITLTNASDDKGRHFKSRFIKPGLAGYPGQFGNALIQKETLDRFVHTLRNKPVVIGHKDKIKDEDKAGEVFNIWFNPEDGWYWCDGIITDKTAQNLIENKGWSVSCAYDYTKADTSGGTENNIPYDIEFLDGEFNHLALVDNPRYEGANIVFNSKVENEDKWITIKPNGEENKGKHLLVKEGESVGEALLRTYGDKNQQKLFDTKDYKQSKEEISKSREEQKQADKTYEKIKDIEEILKDSASKYTIGEKTLEILKDDLKKLKEKGLKDTDSEDSFEKETEQEQSDKQEDKKENNKDKNIKTKLEKQVQESKKNAKNPDWFEGFNIIVEKGIVKLEKNGITTSQGFKYDENAKDGKGEDWNKGALGNLVVRWKNENESQDTEINNSLTSIFAEAIAEAVVKSLGE